MSLSIASQEKIIRIIVLAAVMALLLRFFRRTAAPALANLLLRRGHVRWAMWFKARGEKSAGCDNCPSHREGPPSL